MSDLILLDSLIRSAHEAATSEQYAKALSFYEAADKVFHQMPLTTSQKNYYGHIIYCGLALAQSKLHMIEYAKNNLIIAASYNSDFNSIPFTIRGFPMSTIQEIAAGNTMITEAARSVINNLGSLNLKPPPVSHLQGFTKLADNIYKGNPQSSMYIDRGTAYYKISEFRNATSDYQIAASLSPLSSHIWRRVALCAIKSNQFDVAIKAMRRLQTLGCSYNRAQAELRLCSKRYYETFDFLNLSKKCRESSADAAIGRLRFVFGDVETALGCEISANAPDDVDQLITQSLLILTGEKFPSRITCKSSYGLCLKYVLSGIYKSLSYTIREVPASLWVPPDGRKAWYSLFPRENFPSDFDYPEGFNYNFPQKDLVIPFLQRGFNLGSILNSTTINAREKTSSGLAYMQLIQSFKAMGSYPPLNAIADVAHWMRIVDPLAPLFYRFDMFLIYLKRSEFITELSDYYQRVLETVKFDLASKAVDPTMREKILNASSADDIFQLLLTNSYSDLPNGASAFILEQADHTVSFGIYIPYDENTISSFLSRTRPIWCRMINMINQRAPETNPSQFLMIALEWLYEYEKVIPLMYYSAITGLIIFAALITSYYGVEFETALPDPMVIQMEAILSKDFTAFFEKMKVVMNMKLKKEATDILELPDVVDCFPTYHHRVQGFLLLSQIEGAFPTAFDYDAGDDDNEELNEEIEEEGEEEVEEEINDKEMGNGNVQIDPTMYSNMD
ncbi:hypothetical protein TRFO_09679 [Tritrichomonas foetus]|uniref:Uncharacterized protein n=1 Tax=Tritrichomonas foetus TaxID=1144522 RepID=A0A1J4JIS1_9EUKA|nr:hypothetical protein TRFO_09679 [Tritrichomonas foetus]|eukprot:OHS97108.1 hypothetical protein TRFO_09679 [Tritrichomonas foetus]